MGVWARLAKLVAGLFCYSVGILLTINAHIGYSPWDVFHVGLAQTFGFPLGMTGIGVGLVVVVLAYYLGETLGMGTLLNMILIGVFLDLIIWSQVLPVASTLVGGLGMLAAGMVVIAIASYLYISSGFGAGPRDTLMVALHRKTGYPIGLCRGAIEVIVMVVGYFLGGMVGVGTVITATLIGPFIQWCFRLFAFDARAINHETLSETWRSLWGKPPAVA